MSTFSLTPSDPLVDLVCTVNSSSGGNSVISVAVNDADKKFVVGAVIRECHGESKGGTNGWDIDWFIFVACQNNLQLKVE